MAEFGGDGDREEVVRHHRGLSLVVEASLRRCEQLTAGMRCRFEALCVLERQMTMPVSVLSRLWDVDGKEAGKTVQRFAQFSLATRVQYTPQRNATKAKEELGLRLHDLVLDRCRKMTADQSATWHKRLVDSYFPVTTGSRSWWEVDDDGYILANLSRHLAKGGYVSELRDMLCDIRWVMLRERCGGWFALDKDFKALFLVTTDDTDGGMKHMHGVLKRNWAYLNVGRSHFAFHIFGNVSRAEREKPFTARLLGSMVRYWERPWLQPLTKCVWQDEREQAAWPMGSTIVDMDISWTNRKLVVALETKVIVWSMERQAEEQSLDCRARCVAFDADGKRIVSGSDDKTIRLWDAETGASIGGPLCGHEGMVKCVGTSADGKRIVSGSADSTVRLWDAETGASIGGPLCGHEGIVECVGISADGKRIVSGSDDKTVRLWDAETGASIGGPLRGHQDWVTCVEISTDGKRVVSGSYDSTVRLWDAETGASIGGPLHRHHELVSCVGISADGERIISASCDMTLRLWDAGRSSSIEATSLSAEISADRDLSTGISMSCSAVDVDSNRFVFGTEDGFVGSCLIEAELNRV